MVAHEGRLETVLPNMVDPADAMTSFQEALLRGVIGLQRGELDRDLYVHLDRRNGHLRLTYVRLAGRTVTAFVNFSKCDPVKGLPCFQIGCAVPERFRKQGRANDAVRSAIREMQNGLARNSIPEFYVKSGAALGCHLSEWRPIAPALPHRPE